MRFFHFLDAVCLFVVAAFILLETDATPKKSSTKLKNKGPTNSGNAKPNADASPKTPASLKLTLGNHWDSKSDACHADLTLSEHVQLSDSTPSEPVQQPSDPKLSKSKVVFGTSKGLLVVKYNDKGKAKLTQRNSDANEHHPPHLTLSEPVQQLSDSKLSKPVQQPSGSKLSKFKEWVVNHNKKKSKLTQRNSDANAHHQPHLTLSEPKEQPSDSTPSEPKRYLVVKHKPVLSKKYSSVFAVQPIPKTSSGIFYYEVAIVGRKGFVSIGLATKQMQLDNEVGVSEGYAYQGCGLFAGHKEPECISYSDNSVFGEEIKRLIAGDIVGCGVDFGNKKIFYTLNGERLGPAGKFVASDDDLFPCVSLSNEGDEMEANFGPDFKFKNLLKWDEIVNKDLLPKD